MPTCSSSPPRISGRPAACSPPEARAAVLDVGAANRCARPRGRLRRRVPLRPCPGRCDPGPRSRPRRVRRARRARRSRRASGSAGSILPAGPRRAVRRGEAAGRPRLARSSTSSPSPTSSPAASSTATCGGCGPSTAARRDALLGALAEHLPELTPVGIAAGLHLVAWLPEDLDEAAVIAAGAAQGVVDRRRVALPAGAVAARRSDLRLLEPHGGSDRGRGRAARPRRGPPLPSELNQPRSTASGSVYVALSFADPARLGTLVISR